jgi:hypothetical protein
MTSAFQIENGLGQKHIIKITGLLHRSVGCLTTLHPALIAWRITENALNLNDVGTEREDRFALSRDLHAVTTGKIATPTTLNFMMAEFQVMIPGRSQQGQRCKPEKNVPH